MKKISIIAMGAILAAATVSCNQVRRSPGRAYMPDMSYSRAYETYSSTEGLKKEGVNYTSMPVNGTIARGDMLQRYNLPNDSAGYAQSSSVKSPLSADSVNMKEAERLYLVNCAICHGAKLDGNGPLYKDGNGPYPSKPATLVGDAKYDAMSEGTMYHSITYGRNAMGSYASQLNPPQRWAVIAYIKSKQGAKGGKDSTAAAMPMATADTTKKAVK